jgi:polar amino acid transport system substrate-binding protein
MPAIPVRILLIVLVICATATARAQTETDTQPTSRQLHVATRQVPPFAMKNDAGQWTGIAIELWRSAAKEFNLTCTYEEAEIDEMLAGLQSGRFDAAVAALTMTAEREEAVDFLHPYFDGGLGIATRQTQSAGWTALLSQLISVQFFTAIASLAALLFIVGLVVWAVERRKNAEQFGGNTLQGIGSGFWWSAVTMTTVGYGDKAPATPAGRAVALVWMFASIILISGMTAAIASALTVSSLATGIDGPEDLPGVRIATVANTTSEAFLRDRLYTIRVAADSPQAAVDALANDRVDVVVYDAPILRYLVNNADQNDLRVLPREFNPQNYALALPQDSDLREPLNQFILQRTAERAWHELIQRYLGQSQ